MTDLATRAQALDADDPLAGMKARFHVPDGVIYLDGNSLGLMPKSVPDRLAGTLTEEWSNGLIGSWTTAGWWHMPLKVGDKIAALIGAAPGDVAVGDSTSVNLFKGLSAALHLNPDRRVILAEGSNFPTDSYMAQGLADLITDVELRYFETGEDPAALVDEQTAVVLLSHVDYRTALVQDMARVTADIQTKGALVLWDLSHTSGAVHCDLMGCNADLAVGCTYKYLNGGPGAPAFIWAHPRHLGGLKQPLSGWVGHAAPFDFTRGYAPADGARRMVCGTPQILSLSSLDTALDIWADVDLQTLWAKSRSLTTFFIEAVEDLCAGHDLRLVSPRDPAQRGSHVTFDLPGHGFEVVRAMADRGVIGDFRAPAGMRFGFAPLYLSHGDALEAAQHMADILNSGSWDDARYRTRGAVT